MLKERKRKTFANGVVYALETKDGYPLEVTDTFCQTTQKKQLMIMKIPYAHMNQEPETIVG